MDLLRRAGIERADAFVAATQGDNRNIMASQIAQHIYGVKRVVTRIYDPLALGTLRRARPARDQPDDHRCQLLLRGAHRRVGRRPLPV